MTYTDYVTIVIMNDMFQTDIWSLMAPEDLPAPTQKVEQQAPAAKEKKTVAKKTAKVADTVKCCGRGFLVTLNGKKNVDECVTALVGLGYKEILLVSSATLSEDGSVLTFDTPSHATDDSTQVLMPVTVLDGDLRMELTKEDFPELDEDEISVSDLIEKWTEVNSSYAGCGLCYNAEYGVATPVLDAASKTVAIPCTVSVYGKTTEFTETEFLTQPVQASDVLDSLNLLGGNASLSQGNGTYFVSFAGKKGVNYDCSSFSNGKKGTGSVVEKYPLPFTIHLANFGIDISVTEEDFSDRQRVTQEDVLAFLKPNYQMFGSSDRKADFVFLKDKGILSVASISGKKG